MLMLQSANDIVNVDRKCQKTIEFYFRVNTLRVLIELQFQLYKSIRNGSSRRRTIISWIQ